MNMELRTTGVIRRIDDLGRIVITKEIRRQLCIHEGDPLELFAGDGVVALKKYNPIKSIKTSLEALKDAVRDEPMLDGKPELLVKLREFDELLETSRAEEDHA